MYIITENGVVVFPKSIYYIEWINSDPNWILRAIFPNGHNVILTQFDPSTTHTKIGTKEIKNFISKRIANIISKGTIYHIDGNFIKNMVNEIETINISNNYDSNRPTSADTDGDIYNFGMGLDR